MKVLIGEPKEIAAYERALKDGKAVEVHIQIDGKDFAKDVLKSLSWNEDSDRSIALDLDSAVRAAVQAAANKQLH